MITIPPPKFLNPTKAFRRLSILLSVLHGNKPSQRKIAMEANLSSSMVNSYIKELTTQGLIVISNRNNRDLNYGLTSKGRAEATDLLLGYSSEIITFYTMTKQEIASRLRAVFSSESTTKIILYGASETCELVMHALGQFPKVHIIGIADSNPSKHHQLFHDFAIIPPEAIPTLKPDFILIASFARQDEIHQSIRHLSKNGIKLIKLSTL